MDEARAADLLIQMGHGDHAAFEDFFQETAPGLAAQLAFRGVQPGAAEEAIVALYSDLWLGEYVAPIKPGQSLADWLADLAVLRAGGASGKVARAVPITPALWQRVRRRACPAGWNSFLKRTDFLFAVASAVIWALILRFLFTR